MNMTNERINDVELRKLPAISVHLEDMQHKQDLLEGKIIKITQDSHAGLPLTVGEDVKINFPDGSSLAVEVLIANKNLPVIPGDVEYSFKRAPGYADIIN
jgi:hypothetical protein